MFKILAQINKVLASFSKTAMDLQSQKMANGIITIIM
jgi:hypothetical protein